MNGYRSWLRGHVLLATLVELPAGPSQRVTAQVARLRREQRFQILPAHTQDGIMLARVFQAATDSTLYEDFIEQFLPLCGKWPEPKSVLIMDIASFHYSDQIKQMCANAGVKLIHLPPHSPDLNSIEEFFAELNAFVKREWRVFEVNPE
jgi:DDE superfamily endonuclease